MSELPKLNEIEPLLGKGARNKKANYSSTEYFEAFRPKLVRSLTSMSSPFVGASPQICNANTPVVGLDAKLDFLSSFTTLPQMETSDEEGGVEVCARSGSPGISFLQTIWLLLNLFMGLGMLSKPKALQLGGWLSLVEIAFLLYIAAETGILLSNCYDATEVKNAGIQTYAGLGEFCCGAFGRYMVSGVVFFELFGVLVVCLLFLWLNSIYIIQVWAGDSLSPAIVIVVVNLLVIPTILKLDFQELTFLSALGTISTVLIVLAVFLVFCLEVSGVPSPELPLFVESSWTTSAGIYILSLGGHCSLPGVRNAMENPQQFPSAVRTSFAIMFIMYCMIAICGYWIYGDDVDILVTKNMLEDLGVWAVLVLLLVVLQIFCCISPLLGILGRQLEEPLNIVKTNQVRGFRIVIFILISLLAWALTDYLAFVEAITGTLCTIFVTFLFPITFHVIVNKDKISQTEKICCVVFLIVAISFGLYLTYGDFSNLSSD